MRVTNNMLISNLLYNVNSNLVKMSEYQDELATGKKIQSPSDDPIGISKVLKYKTDLSELEQYTTNTQDALSWMQTTEIAIADIGEALQRVRELSVQAANGSNAPDDLDKIKSEIEQLKNHIISAANTSYAGRYVFSSYHTDEKLMNEDGTYNLDITNYEIVSKPITKYEVGIGDVMNISTNGLDLFGAIETDNLMNAALPDNIVKQLQGDVDLSAQYETVTSAVHQGNYDLSADYSNENLTITITTDGVPMSFSVDSAELDGSVTTLTEQQVVDVFSNAQNYDGEPLSRFAEIAFDTGVLSVTSFDQGEDVRISGGDAIFAHQTIQGALEPDKAYDTGHVLDVIIKVGSTATRYDVDESAFDGTLDKAGVVAQFENAQDGLGNTLSSVADIYYDSEGMLTITPKTVLPNQSIKILDSDAFGLPASVGTGNGRNSWNITIGNTVYDVDESLLDGSTTPLTRDEFVTVLENAQAYSPKTSRLKDAADIYFDSADRLIIEPKLADSDLKVEGPENYFVVNEKIVDTNYYTVSASKAQMTGHFENDQNYVVKKASMTGEVNLKNDYTAETLDITMDIAGTVYTFDVDESVLDGSTSELTENQVLSAFKNASDGLGNLLSDFAEVEFDDKGNITIEARQHGEEIILSGAQSLFGHKSLVSNLDTTADYTASNFNFTITRDGKTSEYEVDESLLDGSLSNDEILEVFKNATVPTGGRLETAADIYFDSSGNLVITASSTNQDVHVSSADPAIFGTAVNVGKGLEANNLDITIGGITYDVDESMLDGTRTELTNDEIAEIFQNAKAYQPDEGKLMDVADIYFDKLGNLVIQAKEFGDAVNVDGAETVFNTSALKGNVNLSGDYTTETLDITINGKVYDVDESIFDGTTTPLSEEGVIEAFEKSINGADTLSDVAEVYFNSLGELVIQVKDPDPDSEISFDVTNTMFAGTQPTNIGRETQEIEMLSGGYITDEMVADATDNQSFVITLDGVTKTLTMEMDAYSTVEAYADGLKSVIDDAFPPQADIKIDLIGEDDDKALVFKTINSENDGTIREFDIRAVRSTKSQMIQDFDDLINALDESKAVEYEDAKEAVEQAQINLEEAELAAETGGFEEAEALLRAEAELEAAQNILDDLESQSVDDIDAFIDVFQGHLDNMNTLRSEIGGKTNRMELVLNRIGDDTINYTQLLSNAEDADMSEIIMKLKNAENVYQASLSTGARVIQPSLIDFIS